MNLNILWNQKYEDDTPKPPPTPAQIENDVTDMPDQADTQLPKIFSRTASARKFSSSDPSPRVRFLEEKQKTEGDLLQRNIKLLPLVTEDKKRPCSRARFDENMSKLQTENFVRDQMFSFPFYILTDPTVACGSLTVTPGNTND